MDSNPNPEARQGLLRKEPSGLSDISIGSSPTLFGSPSPAVQQRPGYRRVASSASADVQYHGTPSYDGAAFEDTIEEDLASQGLGIATGRAAHRRTSIPRVPVGTKQTKSTPDPDIRRSSPTYTRNIKGGFSPQDIDAAQLWGVPSEDRNTSGSKLSSTHQLHSINNDNTNLLGKSFPTSVEMSNNGR